MLFRHLSPSGLVHAGELFSWETICGTRIVPDSWSATDPGAPLTCRKCSLRAVEDVLGRAYDKDPSEGSPSKQQLFVYSLAMTLFDGEDETLIGKLDPEGALLLTIVYGDRTTVHGRFGQNGVQIGRWF